MDYFKNLKRQLNLACPGPWETLHRELKTTLPTLSLIDGAKLDATSILAPNLHVTHSIQWGGVSFPPTYHLGAGYQTDTAMVSGQLDSLFNLQARAQYCWFQAQNPPIELDKPQVPNSILPKPSIKTKIDASLPAVDGHSPMMAIEHEHVGDDFSLSVKAINPSVKDSTVFTINLDYRYLFCRLFTINYE